jgi:hypothetical protein
VSKLKELGLTVKASHVDAIQGHVVVPELSGPQFQKNKAKVKSWMHAIAMEASLDSNVLVDPCCS